MLSHEVFLGKPLLAFQWRGLQFNSSQQRFRRKRAIWRDDPQGDDKMEASADLQEKERTAWRLLKLLWPLDLLVEKRKDVSSLFWSTVAVPHNPHCKLLIYSVIWWKRKNESRLFEIWQTHYTFSQHDALKLGLGDKLIWSINHIFFFLKI